MFERVLVTLKGYSMTNIQELGFVWSIGLDLISGPNYYHKVLLNGIRLIIVSTLPLGFVL